METNNTLNQILQAAIAIARSKAAASVLAFSLAAVPMIGARRPQADSNQGRPAVGANHQAPANSARSMNGATARPSNGAANRPTTLMAGYRQPASGTSNPSAAPSSSNRPAANGTSNRPAASGSPNRPATPAANGKASAPPAGKMTPAGKPATGSPATGMTPHTGKPPATGNPATSKTPSTGNPASGMTPHTGKQPATGNPASGMTPHTGKPPATGNPASGMTPHTGKPPVTGNPASGMTPHTGKTPLSSGPISKGARGPEGGFHPPAGSRGPLAGNGLRSGMGIHEPRGGDVIRTRHIPEDHFRRQFGREHVFHVNRTVLVGSAPRVHFGGIGFRLIRPWPATWVESDPVYIDYVGGSYFLCNRLRPTVRIPVDVDECDTCEAPAPVAPICDTCNAPVAAPVAAPAPACDTCGTTPTLTRGMSFSQTVEILGGPKEIVDMGIRKIYLYDNLRVTFYAGRVSDVR